jgi:regulator of extracellular matrix RemA (YlzA/DUF370 family)
MVSRARTRTRTAQIRNFGGFSRKNRAYIFENSENLVAHAQKSRTIAHRALRARSAHQPCKYHIKRGSSY